MTAMSFAPPVLDPPDVTDRAARTFDWFIWAATITWLVVGAWPLFEMARGRFAKGGAAAYLAAFLLYGAAMFVLLFMPRRRRLPPVWVPVLLALTETVTGLVMNVMSAPGVPTSSEYTKWYTCGSSKSSVRFTRRSPSTPA